MAGYRIVLTPDDNDTLMVTCPALPMVLTFGSDEADARRRALDAIETVLANMIDDGEDIPAGDAVRDIVHLPALTSLKVSLYRLLRQSGETRAGLARRLGWNRESVDRLFRLDHASRLSQLEAAFAALGRRVDVEIKDAA